MLSNDFFLIPCLFVLSTFILVLDRFELIALGINYSAFNTRLILVGNVFGSQGNILPFIDVDFTSSLAMVFQG